MAAEIRAVLGPAGEAKEAHHGPLMSSCLPGSRGAIWKKHTLVRLPRIPIILPCVNKGAHAAGRG